MRTLYLWLITVAIVVIVGVLALLTYASKDTLEAIAIGIFTGILTGVLTGLITSFVVSLSLFFDQFSFSVAGYCVNETVKATKEIPKLKDRAKARDKYRYSLGVVIDDLSKIWEDNEFKKDEWPRLVHFAEVNGQIRLADETGRPNSNADRWAFFNEYIIPVIENINSFSFLGRQYLDIARLLPRKGTEIHQLTVLMELCNKLRVVVGEFDAAYENHTVKLDKVNGKVVVRPISDEYSQDVEELRTAYYELYKIWREWLDVVSLA